jgi:hypothetical protein
MLAPAHLDGTTTRTASLHHDLALRVQFGGAFDLVVMIAPGKVTAGPAVLARITP